MGIPVGSATDDGLVGVSGVHLHSALFSSSRLISFYPCSLPALQLLLPLPLSTTQASSPHHEYRRRGNGGLVAYQGVEPPLPQQAAPVAIPRPAESVSCARGPRRNTSLGAARLGGRTARTRSATSPAASPGGIQSPIRIRLGEIEGSRALGPWRCSERGREVVRGRGRESRRRDDRRQCRPRGMRYGQLVLVNEGALGKAVVLDDDDDDYDDEI